jgi:hypothetical protein
MKLPDSFKNRVFRTRFSSLTLYLEKQSQMDNIPPGSEIDVVYESAHGEINPIIVLVFETPEDCLAFTLSHGHKYA